MSRVYLVTGGARSGKSSYAQHLCESLSSDPIYLATSVAHDEDFATRIARHQAERGEKWTTIEEPLRPSQHLNQLAKKVVLVDCLTLWLTNWFLEHGAFASNNEQVTASDDASAADVALVSAKAEFDALVQPWDATFVFVTNELGSGTHPHGLMARKFVDAQGWFNQHVAARAERVIHMVCGVPSIIKAPDRSGTPSAKLSVREGEERAMLDLYLSTRDKAMDPKGYFLLSVDLDRMLIVAKFMSCILNDKGEVCDLLGNKIPCCGDGPRRRFEPLKVFEGRTAKELTIAIFEWWKDAEQLDISLSHAAYIGREAQRAEQCMVEGRLYQQD